MAFLTKKSAFDECGFVNDSFLGSNGRVEVGGKSYGSFSVARAGAGRHALVYRASNPLEAWNSEVATGTLKLGEKELVFQRNAETGGNIAIGWLARPEGFKPDANEYAVLPLTRKDLKEHGAALEAGGVKHAFTLEKLISSANRVRFNEEFGAGWRSSSCDCGYDSIAGLQSYLKWLDERPLAAAKRGFKNLFRRENE
ncbi:MAG: hypothetical protein PHF51_03495 [Candidatus ainarchaeum sp.]|nr:hypothetical protein [Candidatus ainarchaeum sp.]